MVLTMLLREQNALYSEHCNYHPLYNKKKELYIETETMLTEINVTDIQRVQR